LSIQIQQKEEEIIKTQAEIRQVDSQLNNVLNDLQKHETRAKRNKDTYEQMRSDLQSRKHEIERHEKQRPDKEKTVKSLETDIENCEHQKEMYEAELGTEIVEQLSEDDQKMVDELSDKILKLNQELQGVLTRRSNIETEKLQLDNQLQNNFMKRKDDLIQELNATKHLNRSNKIDMYKNELNLLDKRIGELESKINLLQNNLNSLNKHVIF
jgi:structural maintenance of chromosome 3 (chondroitin sulfate proteoglycan 6)